MKALVLGSTGHLGNAITRELLARGFEVTATSRRSRPAANLEGLPVKYHFGSTDSRAQLDRCIRDHGLVVDAAAPYPLYISRSSLKAFLKKANDRTSTLLRAVQHHGASLVYFSSFTTISQQRGSAGRLRFLLARLAHPYFLVKEQIEARVLRASRSGVQAVIINPTACLGPWDLKPREFSIVPLLVRGKLLALADHAMNVIDVRDVAYGALEALDAECYGKPILMSGHNISSMDLGKRICELGGTTAPPCRVSASLSAAALYLNETLLAPAGKVPYPSLGLILLSQSTPVNTGVLQQRLRVRLRPLEETLRDAITWYRRLGYC